MNPLGPKHLNFSDPSITKADEKGNFSNENSESTHESYSNTCKIEELKLEAELKKLSIEKDQKEQELNSLATNPSISQRKNNEDKAFQLIKDGIFPKDDNIKIILWRKAMERGVEYVQLLQEKSIFFQISDRQLTPVHFAVIYASFPVCEHVIKTCQPLINNLDEQGNTALTNLCNMADKNETEAPKRFSLLLNAGADPNICDATGNSPLLALCKLYWGKENKEVPLSLLEPFKSRKIDVKSCLAFYEEKEKKEHGISYKTGGNYYGNIPYKAGNMQMHYHYDGYTERKTEKLNLWTSKEPKYKKAPQTYQFLKSIQAKS